MNVLTPRLATTPPASPSACEPHHAWIEAQVAPGKYRRPYLFVIDLKYSGKSFRKVVWKTNQQTWSRLHDEAFRAFGGCPAYVVLDNLTEAVIHPDLYAPALNPVYAATLVHDSVVADPGRKGTVENAIQYTQATALRGREFESVEAQNIRLAHWEGRWAALRIHGREKRQVLDVFHEERACLRALPVEPMRYFEQSVRTMDDAGSCTSSAPTTRRCRRAPRSEVTCAGTRARSRSWTPPVRC